MRKPFCEELVSPVDITVANNEQSEGVPDGGRVALDDAIMKKAK